MTFAAVRRQAARSAAKGSAWGTISAASPRRAPVLPWWGAPFLRALRLRTQHHAPPDHQPIERILEAGGYPVGWPREALFSDRPPELVRSCTADRRAARPRPLSRCRHIAA